MHIFQVQVRNYNCGPQVSCTCAVAVREYNIILGIDYCDGPKQLKTTPVLVQYLAAANNELYGASIKETVTNDWEVRV